MAFSEEGREHNSLKSGTAFVRTASQLIFKRSKNNLSHTSIKDPCLGNLELPRSPGNLQLPGLHQFHQDRAPSPSRPRHVPIVINPQFFQQPTPDLSESIKSLPSSTSLETSWNLETRLRFVAPITIFEFPGYTATESCLGSRSGLATGNSQVLPEQRHAELKSLHHKSENTSINTFWSFEEPCSRDHPISDIRMSRSNTLDSSIGAPSPGHLQPRKGSTAQLSVMSGHSGMSRREENDLSADYDTMSHSSGMPGHVMSGSPAAPPTPGSSNANLSGLVCNVHRTTGREPHPLVGATTTIVGDRLYVFGGRKISKSRPALTSDLYELDLLTRHWSKTETKGDIPPPRYFHSVCALGDNKLVCYGGMSPEGGPTAQSDAPDSQVTVMSDLHIYDIPTHTWTRIVTDEVPQGRYAHCAAILPSGAVFTSANAPLSAIHNNPSGANPNEGSIGPKLDGRGGAEMIVVGGQDSNNQYIEQISVFNLRSLRWTSTKPMSGRSCGAYRSVVTPLISMDGTKVGATREASLDDYDDDDEDDLEMSGAAMLIYTNYNFLDVKLELQVRNRDGILVDKQMQGAVTPPGLRFPTGGVIGNNFVVSGTFLTSSKQEFSLWALDLRSLTWARIDSGSSIFSQGSWNRGILWERRNSFIILGNRRRNLVDDYNNRRLNFHNMCVVQLEAFGLYDNPRKAFPTSNYLSASAPFSQPHSEGSAGGRKLFSGAEELGEMMFASRELSDMDLLAIDGTRIPVNSRLIGRRWGPYFNQLWRDSIGTTESADTMTLRPATMASRYSSVTITPTLASNGTTLTANSTAVDPTHLEVADVRQMQPNSRPRTLYLPHTLQALQALVHYLYTGSLPQHPSPLATPQTFCSLLQIARPYQVDGLAEEVVERLHESLDGRNAAAIFNAAAMAAGGGRSISFANDPRQSPHPPRSQSLAGIENLVLNNNNGVETSSNSGRNTRNALRNDTEDEDVEFPDTASMAESALSSTSSRFGGMEDESIWDAGQSHVIGLQKRGLRGLMEGRRIRERGRSDGTVMSSSAATSVGTSSVAGGSVAGSVSGASERMMGMGLGIS